MTDEALPDPEDELTNAPPHRGIEGKRGGCLIVIALAVLLGGGSIGLSYALLQARNHTQLDASTELAGIIATAEKAPGTSELAAAGCDRSGVFDLPLLRTVAQRLEDGRAQKEKRPAKQVDVGDERSVVACNMRGSHMPTCEKIAEVYAGAVKPAASFTVWIVNLNGDVCAEEYKADGTRVGPTKKPNLPPLIE